MVLRLLSDMQSNGAAYCLTISCMDAAGWAEAAAMTHTRQRQKASWGCGLNQNYRMILPNRTSGGVNPKLGRAHSWNTLAHSGHAPCKETCLHWHWTHPYSGSPTHASTRKLMFMGNNWPWLLTGHAPSMHMHVADPHACSSQPAKDTPSLHNTYSGHSKTKIHFGSASLPTHVLPRCAGQLCEARDA